jgi:hypothetical protein
MRKLPPIGPNWQTVAFELGVDGRWKGAMALAPWEFLAYAGVPIWVDAARAVDTVETAQKKEKRNDVKRSPLNGLKQKWVKEAKSLKVQEGDSTAVG